MFTIIRVACMIAGCVLVASATGAQFPQYTPPGALAQPALPEEESMENEMSEARWSLGRVRLDPVVFIRNVEYYNNLFSFADEPRLESDLRASVGAGLVAYLPVGPKLITTAVAVPEYAWWQKQTELRNLIGRYEAGVYGYFNRLTMSLTGRRFEQEKPLNAELETPVQTVEETGTLQFEVDVSPFIRLFGSASIVQIALPTDLPPALQALDLGDLDRRTDTYVLGLRYRRQGWTLGLGVEAWDTEFEVDPSLRSNSGIAPVVEAGLSGQSVTVTARVSSRSVEFDNESSLGDTTELNGTANLTWTINPRLGLTFYGGRSLVYSALDDDSYFIDQRWGSSLGFDISERLDLQLFAETGELTFEAPEVSGPRRLDDYEGFGVSVSFRISERMRFELGFAERRYDSTIPEQDRTIRSGGGTIRVGGDILSW